jgi:hypothetical protein
MKQPLSLARRVRWARRRRERGAAIFIVVLLITMLLGIGLFAARSASLSTSASGHARQMTQAQYLAEYGILMSKVRMDSGELNPKLLGVNVPSRCHGQTDIQLSRCIVYRSSPEAERLEQQGQRLIDASGLGAPHITGDFQVELTDWTLTASPTPGMSADQKRYRVTLTSIGRVYSRPQDPASPSDTTGWASSTQLSRAYMIIPSAGP